MGQVIKTKSLVSHYLLSEPEDSRPELRVAFSQKRRYKAVFRNRIKRVLREAFRMTNPTILEESKPVSACCDAIIIYRDYSDHIPLLKDILPDMKQTLTTLYKKMK